MSKRNVVSSKGTLTPGEYTDRVLALRRALPALELEVLEKLRAGVREREQRLLGRVPEAERELAGIQLEAVAKAVAAREAIRTHEGEET